MAFLPTNKTEMRDYGWNYVDFVIVTGDAYVDHPSFGTAIISRVLEDAGYKVGIVAQPNWKSGEDISRFGKPRYAFLANSGNIDSMVAHYTAAKRKRSEDAYSPGGKSGYRPDRAVVVYSKLIKKHFPDSPVVIGGVEASLRRFAHYDYWDDKVLPSILVESEADILSYGMGEKQTVQIANELKKGKKINEITDVLGTCFKQNNIENIKGVFLPSFKDTVNSKELYAKACKIQYDEQDDVRGNTLIQEHNGVFVVQNKPMPVLTTEELDKVYALPYERYYHPSYEQKGGIPAIKEVEFSITHNRGCFGACNFCSIAYHQGRKIAVRSKESVINEAKLLTQNPHFKGYIHDVGGPSANFRCTSCDKQKKSGLCKGKKCLAPTPCPNLKVDHSEYLSILKEIRNLPKIKKVFIRSGIRFDYLLEDSDNRFFKDLVKYHISGQLKVAPEHCSAVVLDKMGKPHITAYKRFADKFYSFTKSINKEQYLVPYLMSSHPGSTLKDAIELAVFLKKENIRPEQVQDFYPTPGTISTCMYYTELDPYSLKPVFVPKTAQDKANQRILLQYYKPENRLAVAKILQKAGRTDLIGTSKNCLIPPIAGIGVKNTNKNQKQKFKAKGKWTKR